MATSTAPAPQRDEPQLPGATLHLDRVREREGRVDHEARAGVAGVDGGFAPKTR
jgi:hypothetical protein